MLGKKKRHPIRKFFITLILLVIGIPALVIGALYVCFYDSQTVSYTFDEDYDVQKALPNLLVASVENAATLGHPNYGKATLRLSEKDLNNIVYSVLNPVLESNLPKEIAAGYCIDIHDDKYDFNVSASAYGFFQTRAVISTTLDYVEDPAGDSLCFTVESVKIGRITGLTDAAKWAVTNFVKEEDLQAAIAKSGLSMHVDFANLRITYGVRDLLSDAKKVIDNVGITHPNLELYMEALRQILDEDLLSMDFNADEGLEIYFELSKFHNNASYCPSLAPTNLVDYDGCADYLAYLLNAEYVNENDGMSEILTYFVKGYYRKDGTTPADTSITAKIDAFIAAYGDDYLADKGYGIFASGIPSIKNYHPTWYDAIFDPDHTGTDIDKAGFPATWNPDLTDVTKVGNLLTTSGNTLITLEDETLSKQLHATSIYGQTFAFAAKDEAWGITYIAIDDFYLNIVKDHLYVNLGLSLNGYETVLILACDASATHAGFQYYFDVKDVYFGEIAASETLKQAAFSQIATAMASSSSLSSFFAFDAAASQIKIDLASVLNTEKDKIVATLPSVLQPTVEDAFNNLDLDMATEGTTIDGVGTMEFKTA